MTAQSCDGKLGAFRCGKNGCSAAVVTPTSSSARQHISCVECGAEHNQFELNSFFEKVSHLKADFNQAIKKGKLSAKRSAVEKIVRSARQTLLFPYNATSFNMLTAARLLSREAGLLHQDDWFA